MDWELIGFVDSRVYNLSVYDALGNTICTIKRLEARAFCALPPPSLNARFELLYLPVGIDARVSPFKEALHVHDEDTLALHQWLDKSSQEVILQSLAKSPVVGTEVSPKPKPVRDTHSFFSVLQLHRQRYFSFAKEASLRQLPSNSSSTEVDKLRLKFPESFQILERLSKVHTGVFNSSAVSSSSKFLEISLITFSPLLIPFSQTI